MKKLLLPLLALAVSAPLFGALAELNVAEGTIMSPDGSFVGREFKVVDGFKLELLAVPNPTTEGQWVALTWDAKGRLLIPAYESDKLARVTVPKVGSSDPVKIEMIDTTTVMAAEGALEAFGGLYLNANRSTTMRSGIYKLTDTNGDDKYDTTRVIRNRQASGAHGTHTLQLSPDKQWITVINGNAAAPTDLTGSRVPLIWGEDNLVMRMDLSPPGFRRGPDGHINILNQDGTKVELWTMGLRNPVSFAYNKDGEIFVYDADEEPNMGFTVGYRPTSIVHAISGADNGWRSGSKVHPTYYFDYYGVVGEVGSGSPVGSTFGTGAKFPARYQDAFYAGDWSFGNVWAVAVTPDGSSYKAEPGPFVSGKPFPNSGMTVNPADGSMIIMTTGTQLYRVTYVGNEDTTPTKPDERFKSLRDTRHSLEKFHGVKNSSAVQTVWPYLSDTDRATRYAARAALEWQDVSQWRDRALDEKDPRKAIAAIAALARVSHNDEYHTVPGSPAPDKALEARMLAALDRISPDKLTYQEKLDLLRAYHLVLIRMGQPDAAARQRLISRFDPMIPGVQDELNRMVAELLAYLQAPTAATKLMALLREPPAAPYYGFREWINPQQRIRQDRGEVSGPNRGYSQQQLARQDNGIFYAQLLRTVTAGWTPELRKEYMTYFTTAPATYVGNLPGLLNIRADAISQIPASERGPLQALIDTPMPMGNPFIRQGGPAPAAATPQSAALQNTGRGTPGLGLPAIALYNKPGGNTRVFEDSEITAMTRFDEGIERQLRAQLDASNALLQAAFTSGVTPATLQARVNALADAETSLAMVRAEKFGTVKAQLRITPERLPAFVQTMSTRGPAPRGGAAPAPAAPAAAPRAGQ